MDDVERAQVGDIELAYETLGRREDPPVLLVMGLGGHLHFWPDGFCSELTERDLFVVRYDNRDVGLSTHLSDAGPADIAAMFAGGATGPPAYTLSDLAADAVGLIEALGLESAHLVGVSLGGMIVQQAAIEHPERVRSLVSMSSTTGDPAVGAARQEAMAALFTPPGPTREEMGEHAVSLTAVIGSQGLPRDEAWLRERGLRTFDRGYDRDGISRQAAAVVSATDRTQRLGALAVPALVVHGSDDPLVDLSGGAATADAIPGAELLVIDGMGHDLPPGAWAPVADAIARTVQSAER